MIMWSSSSLRYHSSPVPSTGVSTVASQLGLPIKNSNLMKGVIPIKVEKERFVG